MIKVILKLMLYINIFCLIVTIVYISITADMLIDLMRSITFTLMSWLSCLLWSYQDDNDIKNKE